MTVTYRYDNGLFDYVHFLNAGAKTIVNEEIVSFESEDSDRNMSLEVAMQWTGAYKESVYSYANTINTHEGGTHEEGFRAALTSLVNRTLATTSCCAIRTITSLVKTCVRA